MTQVRPTKCNCYIIYSHFITIYYVQIFGLPKNMLKNAKKKIYQENWLSLSFTFFFQNKNNNLSVAKDEQMGFFPKRKYLLILILRIDPKRT